MIKTSKRGLSYRWDGHASAPTLILSNSLGTNLSMWNAQVESLAKDFRVLRYDARGHGLSNVLPGPYTVAELGQDVLALMDEEGVDNAFFCGISLGGLTGLWLGIHATDRFPKLVLSNTAPRIASPEVWSKRIEVIAHNGLKPIADGSAQRWFTDRFRTENPDIEAWAAAQVLSSSAEGYAGCCAALRDTDLWTTVSQIKSATLIIGGQHDSVTTPKESLTLSASIPSASLQILPASHLSNVESPILFNLAVKTFLRD